MRKARQLASVAAILTGCASSSPALVRTVPAKPTSMQCAETMLQADGLDVERTEAGGIMAETRTALGVASGQRDLITVDPASDSEDTRVIRVRVASYRYEPSYSSSRTAGQLVTEVRPAPRLVQTGLQILEQCGQTGRGD